MCDWNFLVSSVDWVTITVSVKLADNNKLFHNKENNCSDTQPSLARHIGGYRLPSLCVSVSNKCCKLISTAFLLGGFMARKVWRWMQLSVFCWTSEGLEIGLEHLLIILRPETSLSIKVFYVYKLSCVTIGMSVNLLTRIKTCHLNRISINFLIDESDNLLQNWQKVFSLGRHRVRGQSIVILSQAVFELLKAQHLWWCTRLVL